MRAYTTSASTPKSRAVCSGDRPADALSAPNCGRVIIWSKLYSAAMSTPGDGHHRMVTWLPFSAGVLAAVLIGFVVRASRVFPADFPLNDGALFLEMVEASHRAGGVPFAVTYNGLQIPFAYPPLAFLVAASL